MNYIGNGTALNINQIIHSNAEDYLSNELTREINSYIQEFQRLPNDSAKYVKFTNDVMAFERELILFQNAIDEAERNATNYIKSLSGST